MEKELTEDFEQLKIVISNYISSLDKYSKEQLCHKHTEDRWSLGELYNHVINAVLNIYFPAIVCCVNQPEESANLKTVVGTEIFNRRGYPSTKAKTVNIPKNTDDKQSLYEGLQTILIESKKLLPIIRNSVPNAKVTHRRLGALNAHEWFQLAEMHSRHHLNQKKKLEEFLSIS